MRLDRYDQGGYAGGGITENGGNISGPLVLAGNPSQTLEAVPKQYVDAYFNSLIANNLTAGTLAAARLPNFTGDLQSNPGTSQFTLVNSGIVAGEYAKISVNAKGIATAGSSLTDNDIPFGLSWDKINPASLPTTLSGYGITDAINTSGGTLTGFLTLSIEPTLGTHVVTKQYVDSLVSGGGIAVGDILRKPYSTTPSGFLKCNGGEVDKTTYAGLYTVIGDSFANNSAAGSGQPWRQQYQINATQSGDISGWTTDTALPITLYAYQAIITKNRVYLLGGHNGTNHVSTVYTAPINVDGTLGDWVTGTALPGPLSMSQSIITKNRVYLLGGRNSGINIISTVYTASINSDGTLGSWTTGTSLPIALSPSNAIITKNRVYLLGGRDINSTIISTVYTAPINSDGTLGTWSIGTSLPDALANSEVAVTKNRVYLLGGLSVTGATVNTVYTAPINVDGTLGVWVTGTALPGSLASSQAIVTKNRVYLLGGSNPNETSLIYTASINSDGTLGTWVLGTSLPGVLNWSQAIITKNRVYLLGGLSAGAGVATVYTAPISGGLNDYSDYYSPDTTNYMMPGSGRPWQQQYQINTTQSGDITGWTTGTALPVAISYGSLVATKNRVYLLACQVGGAESSAVYTAPINTDGTLGTWTTGTSLPGVLAHSQAIVTKNRVYLIGGTYVTTVYTAPINADGTLGAWTSGTALPGALGVSQTVVTKNRVYVMGGNTGGGEVTTVYTAAIGVDGVLGAWSTSSISLPISISRSQPVITKNRIYLCGGYIGSAYSAAVYTATINSDGLIGPWTVATSLPGVKAIAQSVVVGNNVYLFGGFNGSGYTTVVYYAPINTDGTLGTWVTGTAIPGATAGAQVVITKNRVYILGGYNGGYLNTVYTAPISSDLNDYSPYYDGTIVPNNLVTNTNKFALPDFSADEPFGSYSYIKY